MRGRRRRRAAKKVGDSASDSAVGVLCMFWGGARVTPGGAQLLRCKLSPAGPTQRAPTGMPHLYLSPPPGGSDSDESQEGGLEDSDDEEIDEAYMRWD